MGENQPCNETVEEEDEEEVLGSRKRERVPSVASHWELSWRL